MDEETDAVELEVWIDAPPEAVYPFLTDPDRLLRWIGVKATLEPRPGGTFRIDVNGQDVASGAFVELIRGRRVVLTWGWEDSAHGIPPGSTLVSFDLTPERGGTRLTLRHTGLRGDNRARHAEGWAHYTARLERAASGVDPGPDPLASRDVRHG